MAELKNPSILPSDPRVLRHKFNVDEYHRMGEAGILPEGTTVELIEGELLVKAPRLRLPDAPAPLLPGSPYVHHFALTVADYYKMAECGILSENDRVELIEGEVIDMAPIGSDHSGTVGALTLALSNAVRGRALVFVQNPVRLDDLTEPEPDFAILKPRDDFYRKSHPRPSDVHLLIEVAKTSLGYDRDFKSHCYARSNITEYWIVDLVEGIVLVHRSPGPNGYSSIKPFGRGVMLEIEALPGAAVSSSDALG